MVQPASKRARGGRKYHIKITPLSSETQFADVEFDVSIFLQDDEGRMKTGYTDVLFNASLVYEDTPTIKVETNILELGGSTIINGRATLKCKISDVSMNFGNRRVCLLLEPVNNEEVSAGKSHGIYLIRHKIELDISHWERSWYKDEGGRDKAIVLGLKLVDGQGNLQTQRDVPVAVHLVYESGNSVINQGILKVLDSSLRTISNGTGELKVRIDEVSRNHQHQDFQIKISPLANRPLDQDIGGCYSPSVTILSKRNRGAVAKAAANPSHSHPLHPQPQQQINGATQQSQELAATQAAAYQSLISGASAALGLPPLPNPQGGGGIQGAMENLLGWINSVLVAMQAHGQVLKAMQHNHHQVEEVLSNYQGRVMHDLQTIVSDLERLQQPPQQPPPQQQQQQQQQQPAALATSPEPLDFGGMAGTVCPPRAAQEDQPLPLQASPPQTQQLLPLEEAGGSMEMPPPPGGLSRGASAKLMRQVSSLYYGGDDDGSGETLSTPVPNALGPFEGDTQDVEQGVFYVVAKVFVTSSTQIGFPAFSANKQLLGFYREVDGEELHHKLEFIPLSHARTAGHLSEAHVTAGAQKLEVELHRQSKSVFNLDNYGGSLQQLKTNVLFYFMEKSSVAQRANIVRQASIGNGMDAPVDELMRGASEIDPNWFFEL